MATISNFKDAVKKVLLQNGALDRIDAHTKSEVFSALSTSASMNPNTTQCTDEEDNFLVNELILEYLKFNDLQFTESVFRSEVHHKYDSMSRRLLCQTLNVKPTVSAKVFCSNKNKGTDSTMPIEKPVPLIYYFADYFKNLREK